MSYSRAFGFGLIDCPPDFTWDEAAKVCHAPAGAACPPGFDQRTVEDCWPTLPVSCKATFGNFFNPLTPDRCVKACPQGTVPDADNVCQPQGPDVPWGAIGLVSAGALAVIAIMKIGT